MQENIAIVIGLLFFYLIGDTVGRIRRSKRLYNKFMWNPYSHEIDLVLDDGGEIPLYRGKSEWDLKWIVPQGKQPIAAIMRDIKPGLLPAISIYRHPISCPVGQSPQLKFHTTTQTRRDNGQEFEDILISWDANDQPEEKYDALAISINWCLLMPRLQKTVSVNPFSGKRGEESWQYDELPGISRTIRALMPCHINYNEYCQNSTSE